MKHHGSIVLIGGLGQNVLPAIATSMIAITRAPATTNVDCLMKIGQKCFCAVHDKHQFHISFNEALLIGAANSSVSENNPETIDSVPKSIKKRPFLRISENFRKENKETNQTKKKKHKTKIWQLVYLQQYLARSLFFFWFCWLLGLQSFVLCRKLVLNQWLQKVATKYTHHLF